MSDSISRQDVIDALDKEMTLYKPETAEKLHIAARRRIMSLPSVQPDVPDTNVGDMISRHDAIGIIEKHYRAHDNNLLELIVYELERLPSAEPEPEIYWGYTPTYERPLADNEIVPRLRDINAQLGGSYAIDRAIEIIEAVAERRTDE